MNGKKFVVIFLGIMAVSSVLLAIWMKQGYDTRPLIKIEEEKK